MFKLIHSFIVDRVAETPGSPAAPGQAGQGGGAPAGAGGQGSAEGGAPGEGTGQPKGGQPGGGQAGSPGAAGGEGGAGSPTPKYGKFGDTPDVDAMFKEYTDISTKFGKTEQTERNLALLRQSLEAVGFRPVFDRETGQYRFEEINKQPEKPARTKRFNDAHKAMFDEPVLQAIEARVQDLFEEMFEKSISDYENTGRERQASVQQKVVANQRMLKLFPGLVLDGEDGKPNPAFNKEHYDLATRIWRETPMYKSHPAGELYAAMDAAAELGVAPATIAAAKKEGFQQGAEQRKVLGKVEGGGQGGSPRTGKLSKDEYTKLSPEEREKYDKAQLGLK